MECQSEARPARRNTTIDLAKYVASLLIMGSFALLCMEAFWLRGSGHSKYSYIVFTYLTAFQVLLNIKTDKKVFTKLARISVFVYCFHPMAVEVLGKIVISSVVLFLMTAVIATAVGLICAEFKRKMERKSICFH